MNNDEYRMSVAIENGEVAQLKQDCRNYLHEVEQLKAQRDELVAGLKNARYRVEESGRIWNGMGWTLTGLHPHNQQKVLDEIYAALSRIEVKPNEQ